MGGNRNINRYRVAVGAEGQYQPGSGGRVLRNRLGIVSSREIDRVEYDLLLAMKEKYLTELGPESRLDASLICQMHRDWLGDLYEWAGKYRTVEMSKAGFRWPPARFVASNMTVVERETLLRVTPCSGLSLDEVTSRAAMVQADVLMVHPFREGNGRLARWLSDLMIFQAGYPSPDYGFTGRGSPRRRAQYLAAVVSGYAKDYRPLTAVLREALVRAGVA